MSACSYRSLHDPLFLDFLKALRGDYVPLSDRSMDRQLDKLHFQVMGDVVAAVQTYGLATLALEGWRDGRGLPILGM